MPGNRAQNDRSYLRNRRFGTRTAHARVLIVCEGAKTEPLYFKAIRQELRLPSVDVEVVHSHLGTAPIQVVESAFEILAGDDYEKDFVYCVFDQDEHLSFMDAIRKAEAIKRKLAEEEREIEFRAIPSVPCFEIWLLMHFLPVSREMERGAVCSLLKDHLGGYTKSCDFAYAKTAHLLETAYQNAAVVKCNKEFLSDRSSRKPYTEVDDVVKKLKEAGR